MTTQDENEPQARLQAAPEDQREAEGPEDLLKTKQGDPRRETLREAKEETEKAGEVPD